MSISFNQSCEVLLQQFISGQGKLGNDSFEAAVDRIKPMIDNLTDYRLTVYQQLAKTRQQVEYAQKMTFRTRTMQRMFDLTQLNPGESNALMNFAALGLDWNLGKVGHVKRTLDMQRETAASMLEMMTRTSVARAINELNSEISRTLPGISLLDRRLLGVQLLEIGNLEAELHALSTTPLSLAFNQERINAFRLWATNELGLSPTDMASLITRAVQVGAAEDEVRIMAQALGLSVDKLNDLGYMHRAYTELGLARLADIRGAVIGSELDKIGIGTHPLSGLERQFNFIQPTTQEALVLIAELIGYTESRLFETFASHGKPYQWLQGRSKDITDAVQVMQGKVIELKVGKTSNAADRVEVLYRKLKDFTQPNSVERAGLTDSFKRQDYNELSDWAETLLKPLGYDALTVVDERTGDAFLLNWSAVLEQFDATGDFIKVLNDPYAFTELIRTKLSADQLDQLVDSGLLQTIPMSSVEIVELLNGRYGMGFDDLSQLMETDLMSASFKYTESMKNAARQGAVLQVFLDGRAEAAGWIVPPTTPLGPEHSEYVTVGTRFNEHFVNMTGQPPTTQLQQLLVNMGIDDKAAADLANSKMHPIVANTFNQYVSTSWNASLTGLAGGVVSEVANDAVRFGVASGGLGYINRNIAETFFAASWFGFNPGRIKESLDILRGLFRTNDLNFIDGRPWANFDGRQVSKREVVEMFMQHFSASSASDMPNIVNGYVEGGFSSWLFDAKNFPTQIRKWYEYMNANPAQMGKADRTTFEQFKRYVSGSYKASVETLNEGWVRIVSAAHWGETAIRLAFWMSQFEPIGTAGRTANWVGYVGTGGFYRYSNTFEEAAKRMQDAFINPNTMGWVPRTGNTWFGSFLQYVVKAPYVMAKAAVANPLKLYNWHRAHSMWNQIQQTRTEANEAGFASWELEERPHYLGQVEDKYGRPMNVLLFPQGYDSFSRVWTSLEKGGRNINQIMFNEPGSAHRKLAEAIGEGPLSPVSISREIARNAGRLQQAIIEQLTGQDITGVPLDIKSYEKRPSFLIFNPTPRTKAVLEALIPGAAYLDTLNPFGWFGTPELTDASGRILDPGRPGLGGVERYPARALDKVSTTEPIRQWFFRASRLAGINVRLSSPEDNTATNLRKVSFALRELESGVNRSLRDLQYEAARGVLDQEEWNRRDKATADLISQIYWLTQEEIRLTLLSGGYGTIPAELQDDIYHITVNSYTAHKGLPPQVHRELVELHQNVADYWNQYNRIRNGQTSTAPTQ